MSPDVFRDYNAFLREVRAQEQERTCVRPSGRVRVAPSRLLDDPSVSPTDPVRVGIHLLHLGPSDDAAHEAWLDAAEARVLSRGGIR